MKILCIGQASYDITLVLEKFPLENTKNDIFHRIECGGGTSSNPAYLLGKWGMDVSFMGTIGDDLYGKKILKEFISVDVDTTYLEVKESETTTSFVLANQEKGTRTIFTHRSKELLSNDFLDFEPDIILTDGKEYKATKNILNRYPSAISVLDAGKNTEEVYDLCTQVDYIVASKDFAEKATNLKFVPNDSNSFVHIYNLLFMKFKKELVITLEEDGCLYRKDGILKRMPTIKVHVKDSTGAGDFFHAAFVYGIAKGYPYETVLKLANVTASLSLRNIGSRYSFPEKEEVKEILHEFE